MRCLVIVLGLVSLSRATLSPSAPQLLSPSVPQIRGETVAQPLSSSARQPLSPSAPQLLSSQLQGSAPQPLEDHGHQRNLLQSDLDQDECRDWNELDLRPVWWRNGECRYCPCARNVADQRMSCEFEIATIGGVCNECSSQPSATQRWSWPDGCQTCDRPEHADWDHESEGCDWTCKSGYIKITPATSTNAGVSDCWYVLPTWILGFEYGNSDSDILADLEQDSSAIREAVKGAIAAVEPNAAGASVSLVQVCDEDSWCDNLETDVDYDDSSLRRTRSSSPSLLRANSATSRQSQDNHLRQTFTRALQLYFLVGGASTTVVTSEQFEAGLEAELEETLGGDFTIAAGAGAPVPSTPSQTSTPESPVNPIPSGSTTTTTPAPDEGKEFFQEIWFFIAAGAGSGLVCCMFASCYQQGKKKKPTSDIIMPAHGTLSVTIPRPPPVVPQATAPPMHQQHIPLNNLAPVRQSPQLQHVPVNDMGGVATINREGSASTHSVLNTEHHVDYGQVHIERHIPADRRSNQKFVHHGKCQGREVAIITLPAAKVRNGLAEKFSRIGRHPNMVDFVAISQTPDRHLVVVMGWLPHGPITKFLREHDGFFGAAEKLESIKQISKAMKWLSDEGIVQGRLAARNALVASPLPVSVMLSDYLLCGQPGLSEVDLQFDARWAAPEAISIGTWSLSSDIWSFGVLMWEVFSGGQTPYMPVNQTNEEAILFVNQGGRLQCPPNCSRQIYAIMYSCWEAVESRPTFASLLQSLESVEKGGVEVLDIQSDELEAFTDVADMSVEDAKRLDAGCCQMCLSAQRTVMCLPCRHACLCQECFDMIMSRDKLCIICRNTIENSITGYFVQTYQKGTIPGA